METVREAERGSGVRLEADTSGVGGDEDGVDGAVAIAIADTTADAGLASPELPDEVCADMGAMTGVSGEVGDLPDPLSDIGVCVCVSPLTDN